MNSAEPLKFVRILGSTILMQENVEVGSARKYKYSYQANLEQILTSVTRRTSCTLKGWTKHNNQTAAKESHNFVSVKQ